MHTYGGSQINVLTFIVQRACSMHTTYIHIVVLYMISFKSIVWVQGVYSPKTGCILLCFLILCGNMFPDIVHVYIIVLYMICFTFTVWVQGVYSQKTGCITVFFCIMWKYVSFPNGTAYLPSCTVILVMALAYANTAGSAVLLANYTLLFEKLMHLWIHVLIDGLI